MTKVVLPNGEFSDDGSAARDMRNYGYMEHLLPLAQGQLMVAAQVVADRGAAAASASAADGFVENAAGYAEAAFDKAAQTAMDRIATGADRIATAADRQAVEAALDDIEDGPVVSVNGKTGIAILIPTDIAPAATPAEMAAGTVTDYRAMSPALVAAAVAAGQQPQWEVGDVRVTARTLGAGWLATGAVYLQSAYTDLFAQVGLLKDQTFGDVYTLKSQVGASAYGIANITRLNPTTLLAIGRNSTNTADVVRRSSDNAGSWQVIHTFETYRTCRDIKRQSDTVFFVSGGSFDSSPSMFVARFENSGSSAPTFSVTPNATPSGLFFTDLYPISSSLIYAYSASANTPHMWRSTDGGGNFSRVTGFLAENSVKSIARLSDTSFLALINGYDLWKTTDSGISFTQVNTDGQIYPIGVPSTAPSKIFAINSDVIFAYDDVNSPGAIAISRNGGVTWQRQVLFLLPGSSSSSTSLSPQYNPISKYSETSAFITSGSYFALLDTALPGNSSAPYMLRSLPAGFSFYSQIVPNSSTEIFLAFPGSNQLRRSSLYSYDETTQFKTPSVAGSIGAKAYVKA